MNKTIAAVWIFQSESNPKKTYETLQYEDGETSCNCPAWKFKRKTTPDGRRTCKHVRDVDLGMATIHAVRHVEYSVAATRTPQRARQVSPSAELNFQPNRLIRLED